LYAIAKAALEATARTLHADHARDIAALRLGSIYGPGELPRLSRPRISRVGRLIHDALTEGQITVDTTMRKQGWTYAPDVGAAARALLETPTLNHALYNVASEEVLSAPAIAEAISGLLPGTRVIERMSEATSDLRRHALSNRRLREDIGFDAWTPFADGIAATIAWQRAQLEMTQ
jgi:nucleoside-diphosphate-sugar epimerase